LNGTTFRLSSRRMEHRLMTQTTGVSFGIATAPQQVTYLDVQRVWREADAIPEIEHAWLFDHLRPPAMLAKIAATVDIVSGGRLDFGIGAGSRTSVPWARREYDANGLPYHDAAYAVGSLAEACTVIRRLWTDDEPFDFDGSYLQLTGAYCNPKPVQRPYPPIMIGGAASATLRVVAEHADVWNIPGRDAAGLVARSALLDRFCAEIGRDPAEITRSVVQPVSYENPGGTRDSIAAAVDVGFRHVVLSLPAPYPDSVARWVADEIISKSA
jgi:alkanesulfonate monooxygenase SsuD/methylene tetrahydromethanopterin reductase-like flavin-dependent oxidoreductase (luciferase family)